MKIENSLDYNWQDDYSQTPYICKDLEKILKNTINLDAQTHLDVGCGNGAITKNISKFFKKSTGIDLSLEGINQANKNKDVNIDFLHLSLNSLIEKKILYDFVTTIEVIEHQYDPQLFLSQLSQVTKENGHILISTPYHGYFKNLVMSILGLMDRHFTVHWKHGHIKFFSIKTLKELILGGDTNFEIVKVFFSGRFFPLSHSMIFLLRNK